MITVSVQLCTRQIELKFGFSRRVPFDVAAELRICLKWVSLRQKMCCACWEVVRQHEKPSAAGSFHGARV